jgi:uncharacterized membrane-anchored protein
MKKQLYFLTVLLSVSLISFSQKDKKEKKGDTLSQDVKDELMGYLNYMAKADSLQKGFDYKTGKINLGSGYGSLDVPAGYKYLSSKDANTVLVDLWGNPPNQTSDGMLIPEKFMGHLLDSNAWAVNIEYDEMGYVEDDDADDIKYDELLAEMRKDGELYNQERIKQGYEPLYLVGWASEPYYDKDKKILHWAKELKSGNDSGSINSLNYNIRVLGRKGVAVLNVIASVNELKEIKNVVPAIASGFSFNSGYKYVEYDSSIDKVAALSVGGLVAGKVLAKAGFFAVLLKFWKIIAIAVVGAFAGIKKFFFGRKDDEVKLEDFSNKNKPEKPSNT